MDPEAIKIEVEAETTPEEIELAEVEAEAEQEQVETVTDAAVEIAKIEAERDIIIEEIRSETRVAETEALADASMVNQEQTQWQQNIEMRLAMLAETVETLAAQLTPPQSPQADTNPETMNNPASGESEVMQDSQEPDAAEPAPEPQKPRKKSRWI